MIQIRSDRGIKDVPITSMDNLDTFRQRVANTLETIPSYLLFDQEIDSLEKLKTMGNIGVISLMDSINSLKRKFGTEEFDTRSLFELASKFPGIDRNDIFAYWVINNRALEDINFRMIIDEEIRTIDGISTIDEILDKERKESKWMRTYKDAVSSNKTKSSKFLKVATEFEKVTPVDSSRVLIDKITIGIKLDLKDISMEDLFDAIACNLKIPFCSYNGVFKVVDPKHHGLKGFMDEDLINMSLNTSPDGINIKYSDTGITNDTMVSKLPDVIIYMNKGVVSLAVQINLSVESKDVYAMDLIKTMNDMLGGLYVFNPVDVSEEAISASYIIPNQTVDPYVYADLLMMNGAISTYFANDESIKATKKKSVIFSHFFIDAYEGLFSIKNVLMEKGTEDVARFRLSMKHGTEFIKIKLLRCRNLEDAERQKSLFSKVMTMYNSSFNGIVKIYKDYIPFDPIKKATPVVDKKKDKLSLKDIDPELFGIKGYSRTCGKDRKPSIIDDDEVEAYEEDGYQVMRFPKDGEYGTQRNYVCEHEGHPYPGLSKNQDTANQLYPYVPCCFINDQTIKQTSDYRNYYEDLEKSDIVYQKILTTNKFAPFNWYAYLPKNLDEMFTMFDNRFKYIRKGVAQSKSSFLDCILEASGDSKIKNLDEADRIKYVEKKRKALATKIEINSGYQSNWGMSKDDISALIMNMNIYMDPARFCEILEDVYKVNIYLYKRDEETGPMGSILYKRVKFADMERSSKYDNTVCIFEHMGSESDRAKYPMCEIIGQWQANEGENVYLFPHTHSVARGAQWFDRNGQKYYRSQAVQMPFGDLPFAEIIKSQIVDTYGKTRGFIVSYEDEPVVVAVNIMPNFNMNTEDMYDGMDYLSYTCSWDVVKAFLQKYDLGVYRIFSIDGDTSLGIETSFETVKMRIKTVAPVNDIIRTFDTENDSRSNPFSDAQESMLGLYVKNRRYATILKCLFLKEFSTFMKNYDILNIERDDIFKFVKEKILIDQAYKYSDISIYLDKNKSFYKKNKLVVNSRELLIRLVYFLRIYAMRHPTLLREYHARNICEGFYSDLMDYTITPGTIVFSNSRSLLMMNRGVPDILQIQEAVVPGVHTMIIKNPDIEGGNIVKIDLAESYDDAVRKVGGSSGFYATKPGHSVIKMGESPNILAVRDDYTTYYYTLHVL